MTALPLPLPRLPSHGLAAPTADDCRAALRTGDVARDRTTWAAVCSDAGVAPTSYLLDVRQLEALTAAMSRLPGTAGLAGRALALRVGTYQALAPGADTAVRQTADWGRHALEALLQHRPTNPARNAEIADLDLFSDEARREFDKAATRAAERFDVPAAQVTVVLEGAQYIAGQFGLDAWVDVVPGLPVEWSFCATLVRTREPYVVADACADVLQRTNPAVEKWGVRSYAGVPLITSRGHVLGALCLTTHEPRTYAEDELGELAAMASAVVEQIERGRLSTRRQQ